MIKYWLRPHKPRPCPSRRERESSSVCKKQTSLGVLSLSRFDLQVDVQDESIYMDVHIVADHMTTVRSCGSAHSIARARLTRAAVHVVPLLTHLEAPPFENLVYEPLDCAEGRGGR
jgi:hypothetical protein